MITERNYKNTINIMKMEIVKDIEDIMEVEGCHKFQNACFLHFFERSVAAAEHVKCLEYREDCLEVTTFNGMIETTFDGDRLLEYEVLSLLDLRTRLIKELREEKVNRIKEIVKNSGGEMKFDQTDEIWLSAEGSPIQKAILSRLFFQNGLLMVENLRWDGNYDNDTSYFDLEELNKMLQIVEECQTFTIRASNVLERTFEVKARNYEDACQKVHQMLKEEPLDEDDGLGVQLS